MKKRIIYCLLCILCFACSSNQKTQNSVSENAPSKHEFVIDTQHLLSDEETIGLHQRINDFQEISKIQIGIKITDSIAPYNDPLKYATDLGNSWSPDLKNNGNGVVILVSVKDRKTAIAAGDQINNILTDAACQNIIQSIMIPQFMAGDFYSGISNALDQVILICNPQH